jgi:cobalt-zinc-cadmium resistance protein CzcA
VIEMGIGGKIVGDIYEGQRRFDIMLRFPAGFRDEFAAIMNVPVSLANGGSVPLKTVASIVPQEGPREIARENGWRRAIVGINIKDIDIGTYVSRLEQQIDRQLRIPPGYFFSYGGSFENQQRAMQHLFFVVPLALAIIIALLYAMFGNLRFPLLILSILPLALSGGFFILWWRDLYLSISASIGFVALFGVAVLNGIVMVERFNHLRQNGLDLYEAVLQGAINRLRPVLMTALVASLGFVPMAFNVGPGSEVQRPLASVVIGGLTTATLLTLLVLPTLYLWLEQRRLNKAIS